MELGSKESLASTYDNLEAIFKPILVFTYETYDKNKQISGKRGKSRVKYQCLGR